MRILFIAVFILNNLWINGQTSSDDIIIVDITKQTGFGGPGHPDSLGGHGVMWCDVTGNKYPDVYITMNWKYPNYPYSELFYENLGNYRIPERAKQMGIDDIDGGSHGAVFADLNNNGLIDLINSYTLSLDGGPINNMIYENMNGNSFKERTPPVMKGITEFSRGVTAFDFNKNGLLDLVFVSGWKGTDDPPGERNEIYINQGNFNFIKLENKELEEAPASQGVIATDYDGDGNIDILSCNMGGDLVILRNEGNSKFQVINPSDIGITHTAYSGITPGDLNNNGHSSLLFVYNPNGGRPHEAYLYLNNGEGAFTHSPIFKGVDGYMAGLADLNNDTYLDIVFDGHPYVYLNNGNGTFRKGPEIPLHNIDDPRCVAFADIENDGDLDFAFAVKRDINRLYRNDYTGNNCWLKLQLFSPNGQAGAFGAKIFMYTSKGKLIGMREAKSSYGYLAQDDPVIHFGTQKYKRVNLKIEFITGEELELKNVKTNKLIVVK
ncbi:MAG TPA: CRTAC1 family protein [Draconibacterium sp.]|nr:CRTAC1 family protein [Draconibacterium sp.]